jgi:hypothetical protein
MLHLLHSITCIASQELGKHFSTTAKTFALNYILMCGVKCTPYSNYLAAEAVETFFNQAKPFVLNCICVHHLLNSSVACIACRR